MSELRTNRIIPRDGLPSGSSGGIIQVKSVTKTDPFDTLSTSYTDVTGLAVSITPTRADSKILVTYHTNAAMEDIAHVGALRLVRDSTPIFIGDAALEEDYVLASLSWVSKKKLPILFVVDDNNYAVLTKKDERRDWEAKELAKAFKMQSFDMMDDPMKISKYLKKSLFKKPTLVNIHGFVEVSISLLFKHF